jgi:hypothetical protein
MMKTEELAELYTIVLQKEEAYEIVSEKLAHTSRSDRLAYDNVRRQVDLAREALEAARKSFSSGITAYGKVHRNIPFYRKSKVFTVQLKRKTVKFYFNQRGVPTLA